MILILGSHQARSRGYKFARRLRKPKRLTVAGMLRETISVIVAPIFVEA